LGVVKTLKIHHVKTMFGRHQTFPLRFAWLTKGLSALNENAQVFSDPTEGMVRLGVGKNMVKAIQYWLQVVGVAEFEHGQGKQTKLGAVLVGDRGDPYLEDEATLWIIHWLIGSNAEFATGFYWFFNRFSRPRFREETLRAELAAFVERDLQQKRSLNTLKSDTSTLLRMYAPAAGKREDHLDSPVAHLHLVDAGFDHYFISHRGIRPFLPTVAVAFALSDSFFRENRSEPVSAIPIRDLLYGDGERAAIGPVFRLSEDGLMAALNQVLIEFPGQFDLRDTAGVHQLYSTHALRKPLEVLYSYYGDARR